MMSTHSLEQRVAALEHEVTVLKEAATHRVNVKDWRRTVGMFEGDEIMKRIDELTLKVRQDDRKKVRGRQAKQKSIKS
jgi:hypothetical protein